jgi:hypothetical protein
VKLNSWPEIVSDGDVLLKPYVPKGITGYVDDDDLLALLGAHPIFHVNRVRFIIRDRKFMYIICKFC